MRLALPTLILLVILASLAIAQPPDHFHSLDEAYARLHEIEQNDQWNFVHIDTVGYSQKDQEPILLVRVSDNADTDEDEPAVLIVGHIHGEEILGLEIVLAAIDSLATSYYPVMRDRRNFVETYFIPTMNPEGLKVVFGDEDDPDLDHGADVTYRKNKRINVGEEFKYVHGWGGDSSGVDLNRNWGLHWHHGDTLFHDSGQEVFDYYRGQAPFSEAETQVVRDMHYLVQPLYGITYHSSRTGNFSEKVYYPWDWGNDDLKEAPDQAVIDDIGETFASRINKLSGAETYEYYQTAGQNAKMHDWTYAAGNWINMECEAGINVQPVQAITEQVISDNLPGIYYLIDRARGVQFVDSQSGHIKMTVQDTNGNPLVAEVFTPDVWNGYLKPRYTDPVFGVHRRPLLAQNYTVITRKWGYYPDTTVVNPGTSGEANFNITLERKPHAWMHLRALDATSLEPIPATFIVHKEWKTDTLYVASGDYGEMWPKEHYEIEFWAPGYIPRTVEVDLEDSHLAEVQLVQPDDMILDDFESAVPAHWSNSDGNDFDWGRAGYDSYDGSVAALKSGPGPELMLESNSTGEVMLTHDIPDGAESLVLAGYVRYELEPEYDFCYVEMSVDGGPWTQVDELNGFASWRPFFYDLRDHREASQVQFRWRVETDNDTNNRGVFLDDVALKWSGTFTSAPESSTRPLQWAFHPAYPNPFNPSTTLTFDVAEAGHVSLVVYDLLGREVARVVNEDLQAGRYLRTLDLGNAASGVYFARLDAGVFQRVQKIVLMK